MIDSLEQYMRVGTIHHVSYPQTTPDEHEKLVSLKKILCDEFFDVVEVGHVDDNSVRQEMISMIGTAHLGGVAFGGQGITLSRKLNINDLDMERRMLAVQALKEGIDEAYEFGASHFAFLAGRYADDTIEESFSALVESVSDLCAYAAKKGNMIVEIEVFDFDIEKCSLIGPVDRVVRLAREVTSRYANFKVQIDSSHIPLLHETLDQNILPVVSYLSHVHMGNAVMLGKDLPGYGDNHPRFGYPNSENDTQELADYLRILLQLGFLNKLERPMVSFEVKPQPGEDPDLVLANAKRTLKQAWMKVI